MADEFLGRGAHLARAAITPLGLLGRASLAAGLLIWVAGPAPFWDRRPSVVFSVLALVVLAFPGVRLLRHRGRLQPMLEDLPGLTDKLSRALEESTTGLSTLSGRWRERRDTGKRGILAAAKWWYRLYREVLAPLRAGPGRVVGQVTDVLAAFSAPALILSGIALVLGLMEIILCPVAVIVRVLVSLN